MMGDNNPMRRMTSEQHAARAAKHSESMRRRNALDNHLVTAVEDGGVCDVFDFTVPDGHTALVGTGVVVHNCNVASHLMIRNGKLDWTQFVRSNDALWGVPYNLMQWTHLQEYVAARIGVLSGTYTIFADSMHIYDHQWAEASDIAPFDLYRELERDHIPMGADDTMLNLLMREESLLRERADYTADYRPFLVDVEGAIEATTYWGSLYPLFVAHAAYKAGDDARAMEWLLGNNMVDPIYALAQVRFYYHWRWHKPGFHDLMWEGIRDAQRHLNINDNIVKWLTSSTVTAA